MEKKMTDLEIIKKNISLVTCKGQHCQSPRYDPVCIILSAATRMAAGIERLKAALAEKPDIVRCGECSNLVINDNAKYCGICLDAKRKRNDFCSNGGRKEAKDDL